MVSHGASITCAGPSSRAFGLGFGLLRLGLGGAWRHRWWLTQAIDKIGLVESVENGEEDDGSLRGTAFTGCVGVDLETTATGLFAASLTNERAKLEELLLSMVAGDVGLMTKH